MISIGGNHGGPELRGTQIEKAITVAMRAAINVCGDYSEGSVPGINIVFFTPGSMVGSPNWDHGRIAKYSAKQKLVLVQVAVPREMVDSKSALEYVIKELHGANALAFEFYRQKGIQFPIAEAENLVARIGKLAASAIPGTGK